MRKTSLLSLALITLPMPVLAQQEVADEGQAELAVPPEIDALEDMRFYQKRSQDVEDGGPKINAVIAYNDKAPLQAEQAANAGLYLGGRTVLVKDNIETSELPTTAGSLALAANNTGRDAPLIANLRANGGVVLGKTNLSEWANIRSTNSTSGWSAVGGQTKNPHGLDRNPCGSSSGSGAAVAANLAWAAIGTETDGSVTCPASVNGIVGFKPTVGMVSRTYVVPISHSQDTAGPMARSVFDAAMLLNAIAGSDPLDAATAEADARKTDFVAGLDTASFKGMRIGVLRKQAGNRADVTGVFDQALADIRAAGAEIVEIEYESPNEMGRDEYTVLLYELREDLGKYLAGSPANIPVRSLADVIAFNTENADTEMRFFGQEIFLLAEETTDRQEYEAARANSLKLAGTEGIDKLLAEHNVDVLVAPTTGPAWPIDLIYGDNYPGSIGAGNLAAIAGYPHITVPMGDIEGLPIGLSIMGAKWNDHAILQAGAAYERARTAKLPTPDLQNMQLVD
ncbi:amidase [Altererythrobacter sp. ZODW24]|uniref:amidase n=1 Tax=Altererythrobacter sp. ZODW24 TaxID=2185142 RepID=UPI000DF81EDE|nr:amidase [Altererythrobacter sp. ZODW24]